MKTYSSRTKTTSQRKRNVAVVVIALIVLFFAASFFTSASMAVLRLPIVAVQKIQGGIGSLIDGFVSSRLHAEENRLLLHRIEALEAEAARLHGVERQYADMLASFGRTDYASSTTIGGSYTVASVMIRPPHAPFDIFGIDAGENEGVQEGDRVVYKGIVIGVVDIVRGSRSNVKLFSSPQSSITVRIGSSDVEAVGQGGGRIKLEAPKSEPINVGDPVLMPALALDLIGVVREVEAPESNAFQTVFFGAPVSLAEIRYVELHRAR
jgi:cell shape-determining protein MreC